MLGADIVRKGGFNERLDSLHQRMDQLHVWAEAMTLRMDKIQQTMNAIEETMRANFDFIPCKAPPENNSAEYRQAETEDDPLTGVCEPTTGEPTIDESTTEEPATEDPPTEPPTEPPTDAPSDMSIYCESMRDEASSVEGVESDDDKTPDLRALHQDSGISAWATTTDDSEETLLGRLANLRASR